MMQIDIKEKINKLKKERDEIEHAVEMLTFDYDQDYSDAIENKEMRITEIGIELEILEKQIDATEE